VVKVSVAHLSLESVCITRATKETLE
jgi:hypothetical protein